MKVKFLGGVLVLVAVAAIGVWILWLQPPPVTRVSGRIGASKEALLNDPAVKEILRNTYNLEVDLVTGSQVCEQADLQKDFLWPGAEFAVEEYIACKGKPVAVESIFTSPLVFYSWDVVTDALIREKLVEQRGGIYYATDLPRLFQHLYDRKKWKEIGVGIENDVAVIPARPSEADSAQLFAALMSNNRIGSVATLATLPPVLPEVVNYFGRIGHLDSSTDQLFKGYLAKGMGYYPIIVAYESLLPSLMFNKALTCAQTAKMRVIYPEPSVWASHPLIAVTPKGKLLLNALRADSAIQKIAWERYGFRSFLGTGASTNGMCLPMPIQFNSVTHLPDFKTMETLKAALP